VLTLVQDSDGWRPLPVHSYCLDIFAKLSYRRFGRVNLDAIWHWREMQHEPELYNVTKDDVAPCPEVARGWQGNYDDVWCHLPGDEWLAANPVEIPQSYDMIERCFSLAVHVSTTQHSHVRLLGLPAELIDHILSFLAESDLNSVAATCRRLRSHTQRFFKALAIEHMYWLWEVFEAKPYPTSPDWPATWDPCNPPGIVVPNLPYDLVTQEQEDAIWAGIVQDDPDMESAGHAAKAFNSLRREAILGPYREQVAQSLQEWRDFRKGVTDWICRLPASEDRVSHSLDWVDLWRLFNPDTTPLPGIRNRARIWKDCARILDHNVRLQEQGVMDAKRQIVLEALSQNREEWWHRVTAGRHDRYNKGFLRPMWQD
jgi:hypothetical protein